MPSAPHDRNPCGLAKMLWSYSRLQFSADFHEQLARGRKLEDLMRGAEGCLGAELVAALVQTDGFGSRDQNSTTHDTFTSIAYGIPIT